MATPSAAGGFFDYPAHDWSVILDHAEVRRFGPGEELMRAGERERALYVLTEGTVSGTTLDGRGLNSIAAPSIVGELSFIDDGPRSLTIRGLTAGEIVRLTYDAFEVIAAKEPELGRAILADLARIVTHRLRVATAQLSERVS